MDQYTQSVGESTAKIPPCEQVETEQGASGRYSHVANLLMNPASVLLNRSQICVVVRGIKSSLPAIYVEQRHPLSGKKVSNLCVEHRTSEELLRGAELVESMAACTGQWDIQRHVFSS